MLDTLIYCLGWIKHLILWLYFWSIERSADLHDESNRTTVNDVLSSLSWIRSLRSATKASRRWNEWRNLCAWRCCWISKMLRLEKKKIQTQFQYQNRFNRRNQRRQLCPRWCFVSSLLQLLPLIVKGRFLFQEGPLRLLTKVCSDLRTSFVDVYLHLFNDLLVISLQKYDTTSGTPVWLVAQAWHYLWVWFPCWESAFSVL